MKQRIIRPSETAIILTSKDLCDLAKGSIKKTVIDGNLKLTFSIRKTNMQLVHCLTMQRAQENFKRWEKEGYVKAHKYIFKNKTTAEKLVADYEKEGFCAKAYKTDKGWKVAGYKE